MTSQQIAPAPQLIVLGGTVRLTHKRSDGGQTQLSLTRGDKRTTALYSVTDREGVLRTLTARSWANTAPEPAMGQEIETALQQARQLTDPS